MSSNKYLIKTFTDINTIFESGSGGNAVNYKINSADLNTLYKPYATNHGLKYPYDTNYQVNGIDFKDKFQLDIINTSSGLTWNYVTCDPGYCVIKITGGGTIKFNYNIVGATFLLVAGGGAGGATKNDNNAGGGGGAGELCISTFSHISSSDLTVKIGSGGENSDTFGGNGGDSTITVTKLISGVATPITITVNGGGGGGAGKQAGISGGSGGGGGSSTGYSPGGLSVKKTTVGPPLGNIGGVGEDQNNSTGQGGGGGGAGDVGQNGAHTDTSGNGGSGYTYTQGGVTVILAGGGGGGANQYLNPGSGGSGGGGNGGYYNAGQIYPTSGQANTGSGGGGGPNNKSGSNNFTSWGASGGSGVCYLFIPQASLVVPEPL